MRRFDELLELRRQYSKALQKVGGNIRLNKILDHLFESSAITIPQLVEMFKISYPTAKGDLKRLIKANILVESNLQNRPKIYFAPKILEIAYGDF